MPPPPRPDPEVVADLARRGVAIRDEVEGILADAIQAAGGAEALGPAVAGDVAVLLQRRPEATPPQGRERKTFGQDAQDLQDGQDDCSRGEGLSPTSSYPVHPVNPAHPV